VIWEAGMTVTGRSVLLLIGRVSNLVSTVDCFVV
jgi:hypothetical protein